MDAMLAGLPGIEQFKRSERHGGQGLDSDSFAPGSEARLNDEAWVAKAATMWSGRNFGAAAGPGGSSGSAQHKAEAEPSNSERKGSEAAAAVARAFAVPADLGKMVKELDADVLRELILDVAPSSPQLLRSIKTAHSKRKTTKSEQISAKTPKKTPTTAAKSVATPGRKVIPLSQMVPATTFDHLSKEVWRAVNSKELLQMSKKRQSARAEEVLEEVRESIDKILHKAKPDSPLQTKRSAIETLRKIMKTIIMSDGVVADKLRKEQRRDTRVVQCLSEVLTSMTPEERIATGIREEKGETLLEKMQWLKVQQDSGDRIYRLGDVVTMLESGQCVVVLD